MASEQNKYNEIDAAFRLWKMGKEATDNVPKEWFTARTFATRHNVCERDGQRMLRDLLDSGLVETKKFRIKTGSRTYPVLHYKTCKPTKKTP